MKNNFRIFGLNFQSALDFNLPSIHNIEEKRKVNFDVEISCRAVPLFLEDSKFFGNAEFSEEVALLNFGSRGRILIKDGKQIIVHFGCDDGSYLKAHILTSALAIIFFQRKQMLLHASCVHKNGKAISFVGESGAGKSTASRAMIDAGYDFISDDILVPIAVDDGIWAEPGPAQLKLFESGLSASRVDNVGDLEMVGSTKKIVGLSDNATIEPVRIDAVFFLNWKNCSSPTPEIRKVSAFEKFELLKANVFRPEFVKNMLLDMQMVYDIAAWSSSVKAYKVYRNISMKHITEFTRAIEHAVAS